MNGEWIRDVSPPAASVAREGSTASYGACLRAWLEVEDISVSDSESETDATAVPLVVRLLEEAARIRGVEESIAVARAIIDDGLALSEDDGETDGRFVYW